MSVTTRILIVDDDPAIRRMIRISLGSRDYAIHEAATALEGLRLAHDIGPDIALVDIGMPGHFDGFSLCEAMNNDLQFKHTRVIVITGYDDTEDIDRAERLGVSAYVVKPFAPDRLRQLVRSLEAAEQDMQVISGPRPTQPT